MKILIGVICCIFAGALGVVIIGYLLPKGHVATRSAVFKASPEELFTLISGPQNWRPDVKKFEVLPDAGSMQRVRETTSDGETITYDVVRLEPPRLMVRRISDKSLPYGGSWTYHIETCNGGSVLTITEDGEVYNPIFRIVSRFIIGHTNTIDRYLKSLGGALGEPVKIQG